MNSLYPIGTPGVPWGDAERALWLSRQIRHRSYRDDVVRAVERLSERFHVEQYGQLDYSPDQYRLFAVRSRHWRDELPVVLVTGGVHGYETSGVHGALQFLERRAADYAKHVNLLVAPCVSPWGYERIHRWNANALDPNRSFRENSPAEESAALMRLVVPLRGRFLVHIDLHETTDTDRVCEPMPHQTLPSCCFHAELAHDEPTIFRSGFISEQRCLPPFLVSGKWRAPRFVRRPS